MARDETSRPPRKSERVRLPKDTPTGETSGGAPRATQRVAKAMARAGLCSRRDAEAWIAEGRVSVNGRVLTSPALDVGPEDVVLVDDTPLPAPEKTRLFLFHKPRGLVTSDHDPEGRATVADFLRENWPDGPRVVTIGRLDINTEGLLLLTNDGGLARALELPATGWLRRYRVRAKGGTDQAVLDRLAGGVTIEGIDYLGIEAKLDRMQGSNCWLTMGLREGKNREIKRVLEHIGLEVNRLIRLSFGPFQLLDLPEGAVEEVRTRVLRDQLGETLIREAGVDLGEREPAPARREARGERPARQDDRPQREPRPRDDFETPVRPAREDAPRTDRRHVSTLRAQSREAAQAGPRRRIERAETTDPNDRKIAVERLVTARPARDEHRRDDGRRDDRRRDERGRVERGRPERGRDKPRQETRERDGERPARGPRRDHASPSALGKRERIARSGAHREEPRGERRPPARDDRAPRPERTGRPERSDRAPRQDRAPRSDRPPRQDRAPGRDHTGAPQRGSRRFDGDRPPRRRDDAERPRRDGPPRQPRGDREAGPRPPRPREDARPARARTDEGAPRKPTRPRADRPDRPDRDSRRGAPRSGGREDAGPRGERPRGGPSGGRPGGRGPRPGGGSKPRPSKPKR